MIPVMIVEDEFLVRVGLRSLIDWEQHGFSVVCDASSGEKGLELFRIHRPRLILTDIRMSPMDGLEMMRRIRELDREVRFIIISAHSEFEYAQTAIKHGVELYLNKSCFTKDDLAPVLDRIAARLSDPAQGASPPPDQADDFLSALPQGAALDDWFDAQGLSNAPKVVAVCRPDRSCERPVASGVLATMAREVLGKEPFYARLFVKDAFVVMLLGCAEMERVEAALGRLCATVEDYLDVRVYAGISARFTRPAFVHQALSDACRTCNGFLFDKSVRVRAFSREPPDPALDKRIRLLCDEMQSRVYASDCDGLAVLIGQAVRAATGYRTLERIVFQIILSLQKFDPSLLVSAAFDEVMTDDLLGIERALVDWGRRLCDRLRTPPARDAIDELIGYVKEHLSGDISLTTLAERYHFSPNYLGQLFFQKTGIYFSAYVSNLRINRACELLPASGLSVAEVGQAVGIDDPHYFSRLFKERMGVSPNKYQRMRKP